MTPQELRKRTEVFARDVRRFATPLLHRLEASDIGFQLRRAGSSVAANYRSAGRARSHREFTARLGVVLDEADETKFWLEHLVVCELTKPAETALLLREAGELVAIFSKSVHTAREHGGSPRRRAKREDSI
jgi:four helix bundle protein